MLICSIATHIISGIMDDTLHSLRAPLSPILRGRRFELSSAIADQICTEELIINPVHRNDAANGSMYYTMHHFTTSRSTNTRGHDRVQPTWPGRVPAWPGQVAETAP